MLKLIFLLYRDRVDLWSNCREMMGFLGMILYHTAGCGRLLALCLCLSLCLCILAITAPHSNAKSQPQ